MLLLHELHTVRGAGREEFAAGWRDGLAPALAGRGLGRLLWYLEQPHGSGPAYTVVTLTAVPGGAAVEEIARRSSRGDLRDQVEALDQLRHEVTATLLRPLPWSPLRPARLEDLPDRIDGPQPALYMEDTVWPRPGMLEAYM